MLNASLLIESLKKKKKRLSGVKVIYFIVTNHEWIQVQLFKHHQQMLVFLPKATDLGEQRNLNTVWILNS